LHHRDVILRTAVGAPVGRELRPAVVPVIEAVHVGCGDDDEHGIACEGLV